MLQDKCNSTDQQSSEPPLGLDLSCVCLCLYLCLSLPLPPSSQVTALHRIACTSRHVSRAISCTYSVSSRVMSAISCHAMPCNVTPSHVRSSPTISCHPIPSRLMQSFPCHSSLTRRNAFGPGRTRWSKSSPPARERRFPPGPP